jgi:hypothetical protein
VPYTNLQNGKRIGNGREDSLEDRIEYFERVLADNPTGLLALAKEYNKVERYEDEAAVLERYAVSREDERNTGQHPPWIRFTGALSGDGTGRVERLRPWRDLQLG